LTEVDIERSEDWRCTGDARVDAARKPAGIAAPAAGYHEDTKFTRVSKNVYHGGKEDAEPAVTGGHSTRRREAAAWR